MKVKAWPTGTTARKALQRNWDGGLMPKQNTERTFLYLVWNIMKTVRDLLLSHVNLFQSHYTLLKLSAWNEVDSKLALLNHWEKCMHFVSHPQYLHEGLLQSLKDSSIYRAYELVSSEIWSLKWDHLDCNRQQDQLCLKPKSWTCFVLVVKLRQCHIQDCQNSLKIS